MSKQQNIRRQAVVEQNSKTQKSRWTHSETGGKRSKSKQNAFGVLFQRMQSKDGYLGAIVATANKLAKIIYTLVKTKTEYNDSYNKVTEEEILQKKLIIAQKALERIQNQLKKTA